MAGHCRLKAPLSLSDLKPFLEGDEEKYFQNRLFKRWKNAAEMDIRP